MTDYIRDGQAIYDRSFAIIRAEADLSRIPADLEKLAVRVAHASGMVDIVEDIVFSEGAGQAGRDALLNGAPILCDARMVAEGITRLRLPANNDVICTLNDPSVPELAKRSATHALPQRSTSGFHTSKAASLPSATRQPPSSAYLKCWTMAHPNLRLSSVCRSALWVLQNPRTSWLRTAVASPSSLCAVVVAVAL